MANSPKDDTDLSAIPLKKLDAILNQIQKQNALISEQGSQINELSTENEKLRSLLARANEENKRRNEIVEGSRNGPIRSGSRARAPHSAWIRAPSRPECSPPRGRNTPECGRRTSARGFGSPRHSRPPSPGRGRRGRFRGTRRARKSRSPRSPSRARTPPSPAACPFRRTRRYACGNSSSFQSAGDDRVRPDGSALHDRLHLERAETPLVVVLAFQQFGGEFIDVTPREPFARAADQDFAADEGLGFGRELDLEALEIDRKFAVGRPQHRRKARNRPRGKRVVEVEGRRGQPDLVRNEGGKPLGAHEMEDIPLSGLLDDELGRPVEDGADALLLGGAEDLPADSGDHNRHQQQERILHIHLTTPPFPRAARAASPRRHDSRAEPSGCRR